MTQSNTFRGGNRKYFLVPEGVMAVEIPRSKEISGGGKNGGKKELVSLSVGEERIGEHKHQGMKAKRVA